MYHGQCDRRVLKHDPLVIVVGGRSWIILVLKLEALPKIQIKTFVKLRIQFLSNGIACCNNFLSLQMILS